MIKNKEENKMKKTSIMLALMMVMNGMSLPVMATGSGGEGMAPANETGVTGAIEGESEFEVLANRVEDSKLVFLEINPKYQVVTYKFEGAADGAILAKLVLATYKDEEYSQTMVEAAIEKLNDQVKPDWARAIKAYTPNISEGYGGRRDLSIGSGGFLDNAPGVLYYAAYMLDKTWNNGQWVRGKLDYRECTYLANSDPHNMRVCAVKIDPETQEYVFEPAYGAVQDRDGYVSWGEELGDKLAVELDEIGLRVAEWHGDNAEKDALEAELGRISGLADDAANETEIRERISEYKTSLEMTTMKITAEQLLSGVEIGVENWGGDEGDKAALLEKLAELEEMLKTIGEAESGDLAGRVEVCKQNLLAKIKELAVDEGDENEEKQGNESGGDGAQESGGSSDEGRGDGESDDEGVGMGGEDGGSVDASSDDSDGEQENGALIDDDGENGENGGQKDDALVDGDDGRISVKEVGLDAKVVTNSEEPRENESLAYEAEIPTLSEGEVQGEAKSNVWWVIGAMILAIVAGFWWLKRAFWDKKPKAR